MQQIAPEEQLNEQQMNNLIQFQNQMMQNTTNMQEFRSNQIMVYTSLRKQSLLKLSYQLVELFLFFLALGLSPQPCLKTSLTDFFILAIIVYSIETFRILYLLKIIHQDLVNLNQNENRLPYPEFSFTNIKYLLETIQDYHTYYKFTSFLMFLLDRIVLTYASIQIYMNLHGKCNIGNPKYNFIWGVSFTYLVRRYITIGIPALITIIRLIVECIIIRNHSKNNTSGANEQNLKRLKIEIVVLDKISEDNECVICLQEFIEGEAFVRLDCHTQHVFHKNCIFDWLKTRQECPKCRQYVNLD